MVLGELSIFSKRGVELKDRVIEVTTVERDHDRLKQDRYLFGFDMDCDEDEVELNEPIANIPIQPLDVSITGDYLSGAFKDSELAPGPYIVKLWLLVEEEPKPLNT